MELLPSKARTHAETHSTVPRSWLPATKLPPSPALGVTWLPSELLHWNAEALSPPGVRKACDYQQTLKAPSQLER